MKRLFQIRLMVLLTVLISSLAFSACGEPDPDDDLTQGTLTIRNQSSINLSDFCVHFQGVSGELITREEKGTLKVGENVSVDIPIGAKTYYMSTSMYGVRFFSPDYEVSVKKQTLTDQTVDYWHTN